MMLLAKAALGLGAYCPRGAYTMRGGRDPHRHRRIPLRRLAMFICGFRPRPFLWPCILCLTSTGATLPNKRVKPYPFFMPSSKS